MYYRLLFFVVLLLSTCHLNATAKEVIRLDNAISASMLNKSVYGWYNHEQKGKWSTKDHEIKGIDSFVNYFILTISDSGKKYIVIIKEETLKNNSILNTYIINYDIYANLIGLWEEEALIKLPVLKHFRSTIKKGELYTKELLGLDNFSDLLINPRDYFVLQYKFMPDDTVKFLFYTEECSSSTCIISGLNTNEKNIYLYKYIGTNDLFNNFFYRTTTKYFTNFIDSPLKLNH